MFKPTLGTDLFDKITGMVGLDNEPNNHGAHLGSAYQDGWYGYVNKDLRRLLGEPRAGPVLAHLLRQRQPRRSAGPPSPTRSTAALAVPKDAALPGQRLHRRRRDLLRRGALPRHRRDHGALDPLDQPAHLPAGGAGERAPAALAGGACNDGPKWPLA